MTTQHTPDELEARVDEVVIFWENLTQTTLTDEQLLSVRAFLLAGCEPFILTDSICLAAMAHKLDTGGRLSYTFGIAKTLMRDRGDRVLGQSDQDEATIEEARPTAWARFTAWMKGVPA